MSAHFPAFRDESFIRGAGPESPSDFLRSIPEQDPYGESDDSVGAVPMPSAPQVAVQRPQIPTTLAAAAAPSLPSAGLGASARSFTPRRKAPGLFSRIGSGIKRAWSGLASLFRRRPRTADSSLRPSRGPGFWNTPHPALAGNDVERNHPFLSSARMKLDGRPDPYAGLRELDDVVKPDSPTYRSPVDFGGNFHMPPQAQSPVSWEPQPAASMANESDSAATGGLEEEGADAMYDAMPRSGSFIGVEE